MDLIAVITTVADEQQAGVLARAAVEHGLAACVHLERIHSIYRWQGELQEDAEWRLLFKTTRPCSAALRQLLLALHPYELPAIFALPVCDASPDYAAWVAAQLRPPVPDEATGEGGSPHAG